MCPEPVNPTHDEDSILTPQFYHSFFPLLRPLGHMVIVGLPESNLPALRPQSLFGKSLTGSLVGSPKDIEEMLQVAVKHNVRPWIETRPMNEVAKTVQGEFHLSPFVCTDLQADTAPS
jgi:D-arabinose 1-dehydrogenase-like Zn-dependent alcohol dehydrogenase